jgi:calcyclin binding protein
MPTCEDLKLDIEELQKFLNDAQRQRVRDFLSVQLRKLQTELTSLIEEQATQPCEADVTPVAPVKPSIPKGRYTKEITTYGWDQSDAFMKIYVSDLKGVQNLNKENISLECSKNGFKLKIQDLDGKDVMLQISNLFDEIIPSESKHKVKTDTVLVMLKKQEKGKTWAYVTQQEKKTKEKKTPKMDENADPQDSLMNMMKQMYEDGDDEMKRTISKAWYESRNKNPAAMDL